MLLFSLAASHGPTSVVGLSELLAALRRWDMLRNSQSLLSREKLNHLQKGRPNPSLRTVLFNGVESRHATDIVCA